MKESAIRLILDVARWTGLANLARPILGRHGAILMLHRVTTHNWSPLGVNAGLTITPNFLDQVLTQLRQRGQAIVTMDEMLEALKAGRAHQVITITADDAYLDNLTEALPIFEAHDAPLTIYVAPGLISGEVLPWWEVAEELVMTRQELRLPGQWGEQVLPCQNFKEKRLAICKLMQWFSTKIEESDQQAVLRQLGGKAGNRRRFMNWQELRDLAAHPLVTLGAHTVDHFALARLSEEQALAQMHDCVAIIAAKTGTHARHFAYPYGHKAAVGAREVELARQAGFSSAVTTRHGVLIPANAAHPHALPRISVNGNFQRIADLDTLLSGLTTRLANKGRRLITV